MTLLIVLGLFFAAVAYALPSSRAFIATSFVVIAPLLLVVIAMDSCRGIGK